MRRPATRLIVPALLALAVVAAACGGDGQQTFGCTPSGDASVVEVSKLLSRSGLHEAEFIDRCGSLLQLSITESGERVQLDLALFAVFDCRSNCTLDVRDRLAPFGKHDRLCVGAVYVEDGLTRGKIWVNRPTC